MSEKCVEGASNEKRRAFGGARRGGVTGLVGVCWHPPRSGGAPEANHTADLRPLRARTLTTVLAGLALTVIISPGLKGLGLVAALVAGL